MNWKDNQKYKWHLHFTCVGISGTNDEFHNNNSQHRSLLILEQFLKCIPFMYLHDSSLVCRISILIAHVIEWTIYWTVDQKSIQSLLSASSQQNKSCISFFDWAFIAQIVWLNRMAQTISTIPPENKVKYNLESLFSEDIHRKNNNRVLKKMWYQIQLKINR